MADGDSSDGEHDDLCYACGDVGDLLLCDLCSLAWHRKCLEPPLDKIPKGVWRCPECIREEAKMSAQEEEAGKRPARETREQQSARESREKRERRQTNTFVPHAQPELVASKPKEVPVPSRTKPKVPAEKESLLQDLQGRVNLHVDWEAMAPQQHDAVAACIGKNNKFKLADAIVVGEKTKGDTVQLQFDIGHHIQWIPLRDVYPLLDAISLPLELTVGSTVQACDPYASEAEKDVYWPVTIEKAKVAANGRTKFWVKYNIDQSGQWVDSKHLKLDEAAKPAWATLKVKSKALGVVSVKRQCRTISSSTSRKLRAAILRIKARKAAGYSSEEAVGSSPESSPGRPTKRLKVATSAEGGIKPEGGRAESLKTGQRLRRGSVSEDILKRRSSVSEENQRGKGRPYKGEPGKHRGETGQKGKPEQTEQPELIEDTQAQKADNTYRVECGFCTAMGNLNEMLICDICDTVAHIYCSKPPLEEVPSSGWLCPDCVEPQPKEDSRSKEVPKKEGLKKETPKASVKPSKLNHVTPQQRPSLTATGPKPGGAGRDEAVKASAKIPREADDSEQDIEEEDEEDDRAEKDQREDIRHSEWRRYLEDAVSNVKLPAPVTHIDLQQIKDSVAPKHLPPPWPIGISARIRSIPKTIRDNAPTKCKAVTSSPGGLGSLASAAQMASVPGGIIPHAPGLVGGLRGAHKRGPPGGVMPMPRGGVPGGMMPGMSGVPTSVGLAGMMAGGSQAGMVGMQSLQGQQEALRQMQMAQMQAAQVAHLSNSSPSTLAYTQAQAVQASLAMSAAGARGLGVGVHPGMHRAPGTPSVNPANLLLASGANPAVPLMIQESEKPLAPGWHIK